MTAESDVRRRITLGQFTLELQMRAAQQAGSQATKPNSPPATLSENAIASRVALGLAKRRVDR